MFNHVERKKAKSKLDQDRSYLYFASSALGRNSPMRLPALPSPILPTTSRWSRKLSKRSTEGTGKESEDQTRNSVSSIWYSENERDHDFSNMYHQLSFESSSVEDSGSSRQHFPSNAYPSHTDERRMTSYEPIIDQEINHKVCHASHFSHQSKGNSFTNCKRRKHFFKTRMHSREQSSSKDISYIRSSPDRRHEQQRFNPYYDIKNSDILRSTSPEMYSLSSNSSMEMSDIGIRKDERQPISTSRDIPSWTEKHGYQGKIQKVFKK